MYLFMHLTYHGNDFKLSYPSYPIPYLFLYNIYNILLDIEIY